MKQKHEVKLENESEAEANREPSIENEVVSKNIGSRVIKMSQ